MPPLASAFADPVGLLFVAVVFPALVWAALLVTA